MSHPWRCRRLPQRSARIRGARCGADGRPTSGARYGATGHTGAAAGRPPESARRPPILLQGLPGALAWSNDHSGRSRGRAPSREAGGDPAPGQGGLADDPQDDARRAPALSRDAGQGAAQVTSFFVAGIDSEGGRTEEAYSELRERAELLASGDFAAAMAWIADHGGVAEAIVSGAPRRGLHGPRLGLAGNEPRTPLRFVLPAGTLA